MIQIYTKQGKYMIVMAANHITTCKRDKLITTIGYGKKPKGTVPALFSLIVRAAEIYEETLDWDVFESTYKKAFEFEEIQVEEIVEDLLDIVPAYSEIIEYFPHYARKDFEIIMTVACSDKWVENLAWLSVVSPPSTGKSFMLKLFNHPTISFMVDEFTENSMAGGRPNMDAPPVDSMFARSHHKNMILNDMSSILTLKREKVEKFLGALTAGYGQTYTKHSPGGVDIIKTGFSVIMGITPRLYKQQRKFMSVIGSRMLYLKLFRPPSLRLREDRIKYNKEELRLKICTFVKNMMYNKSKVQIPSTLDDRIWEFTKKVIIARNLKWVGHISELEGEARLYNQLILLTQTHAKIFKRTVAIDEDFDLFKQIALETIPYVKNLQDIGDIISYNDHNKWTKDILNNAIRFEMVEVTEIKIVKSGTAPAHEVAHYTWTEEWMDFFTPLFSRNDIYDEDEITDDI